MILRLKLLLLDLESENEALEAIEKRLRLKKRIMNMNVIYACSLFAILGFVSAVKAENRPEESNDEFLMRNAPKGLLFVTSGEVCYVRGVAKFLSITDDELASLKEAYERVYNQREQTDKVILEAMKYQVLFEGDEAWQAACDIYSEEIKEILPEEKRLTMAQYGAQYRFEYFVDLKHFSTRFELTEKQTKKIKRVIQASFFKDYAPKLKPNADKRSVDTSYLVYKVLDDKQRKLAVEFCGKPYPGGWLEYALSPEAAEAERLEKEDLAKRGLDEEPEEEIVMKPRGNADRQKAMRESREEVKKK